MDIAAYHALRDLQDQHWWFAARRRIVANLIRRFVPLAGQSKVLEAGCGYGGNLKMLEQFGDLDSFEFDDCARNYASTLARRPVAYGYLPNDIGFDDDRFDLIAMLDVLEHIDDDASALRTLRDRLSQRGALVVTVPALPWLWSRHDETHHHKRRYTKVGLNKALNAAGLRVVKTGYFNSLLFPLAVAQRLLSRWMKRNDPAETMPPPPLNGLLRSVFAFERHILGRVGFPIGLSIYAIAVPA